MRRRQGVETCRGCPASVCDFFVYLMWTRRGGKVTRGRKRLPLMREIKAFRVRHHAEVEAQGFESAAGGGFSRGTQFPLNASLPTFCASRKQAPGGRPGWDYACIPPRRIALPRAILFCSCRKVCKIHAQGGNRGFPLENPPLRQRGLRSPLDSLWIPPGMSAAARRRRGAAFCAPASQTLQLLAASPP